MSFDETENIEEEQHISSRLLRLRPSLRSAIVESAIGDHSPEDAATSMLTVKQILLERLPGHSGTFSNFSDDHHRALESNQRFRKHERPMHH